VGNAMKIWVVVAAVFAAKSEATTDYYRIYGNSCHSITHGLTGEYAQHGFGNNSSTQALTVVCPVTVPDENYSEGYIGMAGYDRHPTEILSCTMNFSSPDGNVLNTATSKTSGSDNFNVKYGNGVRVSPTSDHHILWESCRIPPKSGGWMSVLTSVYLNLTY